MCSEWTQLLAATCAAVPSHLYEQMPRLSSTAARVAGARNPELHQIAHARGDRHADLPRHHLGAFTTWETVEERWCLKNCVAKRRNHGSTVGLEELKNCSLQLRKTSQKRLRHETY